MKEHIVTTDQSDTALNIQEDTCEDMGDDVYVFPASFAQQRLWFIDQFAPGGVVYNMTLALRLEGALDQRALEHSINELVNRHEVLRTTFSMESGQLMQIIHPAPAAVLPVDDISGSVTDTGDEKVQRWIEAESKTPFDLAVGPLIRVRLLRVAEQLHVLQLSLHHIISDGWSMDVLSRELGALYAAYRQGQASPLPELPIQYADFAVWQREWLQEDVLEQQLDYWKSQLAGMPALELPTDNPRPAIQRFEGAHEYFELTGETTATLRQLGQGEGATLFMVLLAAFQTLLYRYTGQTDIAVGTPIAGRNRPEIEGLIGFFVNSLLLRVDISSDPAFGDLLGRVRDVALDAYGHQDLPFEKLVEELVPGRDMSRNPLFQVMFVLQNASTETLRLADVNVTRLTVPSHSAKFDLTLVLHEVEGRLRGQINYNTDLFNAGTIKRLVRHYQTLLEAIIASPDQKLSKLQLLTEAERQQLLVTWNAGESDYPRDKSVCQLFTEQATRTPDATAVVFEEQRLSYGELNARANQLAHYLSQQGVGPDVLVGLCLERSLQMVVGVLGILKAGGAYVPLDPGYPKERLAFMLDDAQVSVLVTETAQTGKLPTGNVEVTCLDRDWPQISEQPTSFPETGVTAEHLAYVIYTSGSTGNPKGVCVSHRAINRLVSNTNYIQLGPDDRISQVSNISFDAATFEIWGALLSGAELVIIDKDILLSPRDFAEQLQARGITALFLTTALFNLMAQQVPGVFATLNHVLFGGEAVDVKSVQKVLGEGAPRRLLHVYGPTECTTFATWHEVKEVTDGSTTIPIGRPLSNTEAYLLDRDLNPVPVGVTGELYLGGDGLARGYLNRPELTAEKFIPNPFSDKTESRLYKTGDLAKYHSNGTIEFLGRIDHQVKVRGFRIELGEIEAVLRQCPRVLNSAVIVHEDSPGDKRLVAYVVSEQGQPLETSELRDYLKQKLPEYMIPAAFVMLESLPLTPNGKVDRQALPEPQQAFSKPRPGVARATDPMVLHLTKIWEDVLGVAPIAVRDNFFDLGGHSLLAVKLFDQIEKYFGKKLPLDTLWFEGGTIEHIAQLLKLEQESVTWPELVAMQGGGNLATLFCIHTMGGNLFHYNDLVAVLGSDQPVYGLQARGVYGRGSARTSIEAIAADCIAAMRAFQPHGPYRIAGFSSGGPVAFEMAQQLSAAGEDVERLIMLDSFSLGSTFTERFLGQLRRLLQFTSIRDTQERLYHLILSNLGLSRLRKLQSIGEAHRWAHWSYKPRPYNGRIDLLVASQSVKKGRDANLGWSQLAQGEFIRQEVPGAHGSMVKPPHVFILAEKLKEILG